jgi:hypothetical protein
LVTVIRAFVPRIGTKRSFADPWCFAMKRRYGSVHQLNGHPTDRGCTRPGCTSPGYRCQAHHVNGWAAQNGQTNINDLTQACGPDNRLIEESGWKTRKRKDGRTEWIPPPHLDTGQTRVNNYHHPENYLLPEEDDDDDP